MNRPPVALRVLPDELSICRLDPGDPSPAWVRRDRFHSVTRTSEELSVVCHSAGVPEGVRHTPGWRGLAVAGPLDFSEVGILLSLSRPLADAGISIFAISTFDTDYVLLPRQDLEHAIHVLEAAGHRVEGGSS